MCPPRVAGEEGQAPVVRGVGGVGHTQPGAGGQEAAVVRGAGEGVGGPEAGLAPGQGRLRGRSSVTCKYFRLSSTSSQ